MTTHPPIDTPRRKSEYISQSECSDAHRCHLRWFGRWPLALMNEVESTPQRIGSIGHAVLASMGRGDKHSFLHREAALAEAYKRRWFAPDVVEPDWFEDEYLRAYRGAAVVDDEVPRGAPVRLPCGTPLIEHRLRVGWLELISGMAFSSSVLGCTAFSQLTYQLRKMGRLGIEGQMDFVHRVNIYGDGTTLCSRVPYGQMVTIDDYKFRQKPDLGGALGRPDVSTVDPQGAFYAVLLLASGAVGPDEQLAFRQINTYAGPWLTVDDFVEERRRVQASGARGRLTVDGGLPSRDLDRMEAMVSPEVWGEAFRVLANMRHDERRAVHDGRMHQHRQDLAEYEAMLAANPKSRKKPPRAPDPPDRVTAAEEQAARAFVADLGRRPLHQVQTFSLGRDACLELVRDMLAAVLSAEREMADGLPPARSWDSHPRGPCVRPYGCDLAQPCRATLGSGNAAETLRELAATRRAHASLTVLPAGVGGDPA